MEPYATIKLELRKAGIIASCEDTQEEAFIKRGDGNALMDFINNVEDICDPEATFTLTDKGREYLKHLLETTPKAEDCE